MRRFFNWLTSKIPRSPMNRVKIVTFDANEIGLVQCNEISGSIRVDEIERVRLRTTTAGPFDEDAFIIVDGPERSWVIPQAARLRLRLPQSPASLCCRTAVVASHCSPSRIPVKGYPPPLRKKLGLVWAGRDALDCRPST